MADWTDAFGAVTGGLAGIANIGIGIANVNEQRKIAAENRALQREFAQNSIQWRVADAKKAGIHPLYSLGANTPTYTPQSMDSFGYSQISQGVRDISNSVSAYNVAKNQRLQNELLESQIQAQQLSNKALKDSLKDSLKSQHSRHMEQIAPAIADVPTKKNSKNSLPYGRSEVKSESSYQKVPSDNPYGKVTLIPDKDAMDWYSEGLLNQFQWHMRNSNPFRNPWTENDIAKYSRELAKAGVPLDEIDILQSWTPAYGWTMEAVPKKLSKDESFLKRKVREFKGAIDSIRVLVPKSPF